MANPVSDVGPTQSASITPEANWQWRRRVCETSGTNPIPSRLQGSGKQELHRSSQPHNGVIRTGSSLSPLVCTMLLLRASVSPKWA